MDQRTPLYEQHLQAGGRIVPFAGWELPIWYTSLIDEHQVTRTAAGMFDVSHMGEIFVEGPEAELFLDSVTCNAVKNIPNGKAQYNALPNEKGGVVDDIIVYRYSPTRYLVCVNASNTTKDFEWLTKNNTFNCTIKNRSSEFGQIAVQGPKGVEVVSRLSGGGILPTLKSFEFRDLDLEGTRVIAARTGYTGEDGIEIFIPWAETAALWDALLMVGKDLGLQPCGLGARDSLRLEACLPLHGHELGDDISVIESGLSWILKLDKGNFIGRAALEAEKTKGSNRALAGFFVEDAGIARHGDRIQDESGNDIGLVTSGTKTPTVDRALGMALVKAEFSAVGSVFWAVVRGRKLRCVVTKRPFYRRAK